LRENLGRTQLDAKLVAANALNWKPKQQFDAILLDAPCSATGTFRRHPEVLYRARPRVIAEGAELQLSLLERASQWLSPGGALVYSVCSLEPEEGEGVIRSFLQRHSELRVSAPSDLPDFAAASPQGWVRILPDLLEAEGGLDGFFMARLVRNG
jgi:16S rRNA (cytosine967-C5)-methyltransferase